MRHLTQILAPALIATLALSTATEPVYGQGNETTVRFTFQMLNLGVGFQEVYAQCLPPGDEPSPMKILIPNNRFSANQDYEGDGRLVFSRETPEFGENGMIANASETLSFDRSVHGRHLLIVTWDETLSERAESQSLEYVAIDISEAVGNRSVYGLSLNREPLLAQIDQERVRFDFGEMKRLDLDVGKKLNIRVQLAARTDSGVAKIYDAPTLIGESDSVFLFFYPVGRDLDRIKLYKLLVPVPLIGK